MAFLSDLVREVAKVEGIEEVSVGIFARHAREAGLIRQGGRGKSAAKMNLSDAANLLMAVNGCGLAKDIAENVPKIRALPLLSRCADHAYELEVEDLSFGESLERFIHLMMNEEERTSYPGMCFIKFSRPELRVEIKCYPAIEGLEQGATLTYGTTEDEHSEMFGNDRLEQTVISYLTLSHVAKVISD